MFARYISVKAGDLHRFFAGSFREAGSPQSLVHGHSQNSVPVPATLLANIERARQDSCLSYCLVGNLAER